MTKIVKIEDDWRDVKNTSRTTVGKAHTENEASTKFKEDILISEHSPIRLIKVRWLWKEIKSWIATHFSRAKWECFITTARSDRTGIDRGELSQNYPVNFDGEANAQHLIDTARKRLCYCSSKETRELMEDLKVTIGLTEPELADVLVPNGVYRGGCPEVFSKCTYCVDIVKDMDREDFIDLKKRYKVYNDYFLNEYKK